MALKTSIRLRVATGSGVAVVLAAVAMTGALVAAAGERADARVLSQRLVPAVAAAVDLLNLYQAQQTWLREYVTDGVPSTLAPFHAQATQIRQEQDRIERLTRGYGPMTQQLNATVAAEQS